jgi:hypothetical protein
MTDEGKQSANGGGGAGTSRVLRPLAVGAAVAGAVIGGRALLNRRKGKSEEAGDSDANGGKSPAKQKGQEAPDLTTELRGAATSAALTLLDRATARLEQSER